MHKMIYANIFMLRHVTLLQANSLIVIQNLF
jgi:hypothetical protein